MLIESCAPLEDFLRVSKGPIRLEVTEPRQCDTYIRNMYQNSIRCTSSLSSSGQEDENIWIYVELCWLFFKC